VDNHDFVKYIEEKMSALEMDKSVVCNFDKQTSDLNGTQGQLLESLLKIKIRNSISDLVKIVCLFQLSFINIIIQMARYERA
jgi:hypothetical protein